MFDPKIWAQVPFSFWTLCSFVFGCIVGSFLNVCIYRLPRNESIAHPPSHCPHCGYAIPWYLNIPLFTWLWLGGKCANCQASISVRYFLVEFLTGAIFAAVWMRFGHFSPWVAVVGWVLLAGLIAATFIDFEHFIIPDEITFGGMAVGFCAAILVPSSHLLFPNFNHITSPIRAMADSVLGMAVGGGIVYAILRLGKFLFGRLKLDFAREIKIVFTETEIRLPEEVYAYEELFYRRGDTVHLQARTVELVDRCYWNVAVQLRPAELRIGEEILLPETVPHLEVTTRQLILPREAMGQGDVKFMAAIGAFLGWPAVIFSLAVSAMIGSIAGITLVIFNKRAWSSRMPYGPYIAAAAVLWFFDGPHFLQLFYRAVDALHGGGP